MEIQRVSSQYDELYAKQLRIMARSDRSLVGASTYHIEQRTEAMNRQNAQLETKEPQATTNNEQGN